MYLKSLEINGFKSFAKKTDLDFKSRISCIVGPNGSGKSNTSEAFRFVLGEQSMKNMRGKRGEDLIFTGVKGRLNRGSVKVSFDNSDKTLDVDYDEVQIERVVYRDGTNEYFLNKNKVRAKDIVSLFAAANIGSSGHHIISQGEADRILSLTPKDRKSLVEEALGLKVFVIKKEEALKKLKKTEENLREVKVRERVNAPRINFLKKEVEKIQKSKDIRKELESLYALFFSQKKNISRKIFELDSSIKGGISERAELEKAISFKKAKIEEIKNNGKNAVDFNEEDMARLEGEGKEIDTLLSSTRKEIARNEIFIESELQKKAKFEAEGERVEENLKIYNKKLDNISEVIHYAWMNWAKTILDQESISKERRDRWSKRFVAYLDLPESSKAKDREYGVLVLDRFGMKKDGVVGLDFNIELIESKEKENTIFVEKIKVLEERKDSINKKIKMLDVGNGEVAKERILTEIEIEILKIEKEAGSLNSVISDFNNKKFRYEREVEMYVKEESFARSLFGEEKLSNFLNFSVEEGLEIPGDLREKITRFRITLENMGDLRSDDLLGEYQGLVTRQEFVKKELIDLLKTKDDLNVLIKDLSFAVEKKFRIGVDKINAEFSKFFSILFSGGHASLNMVRIPIKNDDEKMEEFELGLDMKVSLPNKKISGLSMLSGGERSLTSISLLFAMSSITPPPFIILDETDAALDEANSKRYGDMIERLAEHSQLILITHNRETMSRAGILYGVTMGNDGVSKLISVSFEDAEKVAK